jgi:uncharacterized protein (TIGR03437 family)
MAFRKCVVRLSIFCASFSLISNAQVIVNAASGGQAVAPGSIISVYGIASGVIGVTGQATTLPLPTSISGGRVYLSLLPISFSAVNRVSLFYWSPSQVNALLPETVAPGSVTIAVRSASGGADVPAGSTVANVQTQAPGIFVSPIKDCSVSVDGCSQQLTRAILTDSRNGLILSTNPARPRQGIAIWCTGLGTLAQAPEVTILPPSGAPINVQVFFSGHTTFAGLDQVNFYVPEGSALGSPCVVGSRYELQLSMRSTISAVQSNVLSLPVLIDSCK